MNLFFAAINGILFALFGAVVVEKVAVQIGNAEVGFLDTRQHFLVQLVLECLVRRQDTFRVGIFGFEVSNHFRVLTFVIAQPEVVIHAPVAMQLENARFRFGNGWCRTGCLCHDCK